MAGLTLQQFVSDALSQIFLGIKGAQDVLEKEKIAKYRISPAIHHVGQGADIHESDVVVYRPNAPLCKGHLIQFDVAVHAGNIGKKEAGLQVAASGSIPSLGKIDLKTGGGGASATEEKTVSRIKFAIPVIFEEPPAGAEDDAEPSDWKGEV